MTKVAITGGIGSGKSFVCQRLEERGLRVYDCDKAAKRVMRESAAVKDALMRVIGSEAYSDGQLNKAVIAKYLLASEVNAARINSIVHPAVAADFKASGYSWMECAILFTSGFDRYVDKVICVTAPLETRVRRIMERDGITREKAAEWIERQMSQEETARRSDFVIENDGSRAVEPQIDTILNKLII